MVLLVNILSFLWLVRTIKFVLFWVYLWQLKEYHIGRFVDHFRTHKGKQILLNPLQILKYVLLVVLLINYYFFNGVFYALFAVYCLESALFTYSVIRKQFKKPVLTKKTLFLTLISILVILAYMVFSYTFLAGAFDSMYFYIFWFVASLLLFDIFTPLIVSAIVLFVQPFFVIVRNVVLKKAKKKMSSFKNVIVIGITGSYGKTSTKEFLHTILSSKFNVLATPEHKNSEMGIAQTILKELRPEHQIFIVEMGSYNKGGINLLCNMVMPTIGLVTGVNEQHLATFGSLENLLSAEGGRELAQCLPKDGLIVVNGENKYCLDLYKKTELNKRIYTLKRDRINSDIWTEDILVQKDSVSFVAVNHNKEMSHFAVNVLGGHNVQNLLGAITVAKELGMTMQEISQACKDIKPGQAGIALKEGVHGIDIIDSSYSSNPDGVVADLGYLNVFPGKKIMVMPCLIELGEASARVHEELGKKIAEVCDLAIVTTKDKFKEISEGFISAGKPEHKIVFSENPKDIFAMITTMCKEGDAVLLEGRVPGELIKLLHG